MLRTDVVVECGCSPRVLTKGSVLYKSMIGTIIPEAAVLSKVQRSYWDGIGGKANGLYRASALEKLALGKLESCDPHTPYSMK